MYKLDNISHLYFIGIGGIGMSALARYFNTQGKQVAGYDRVITGLSKQLEQEGIDIHYNDNFEAIPEAFKDPEQSLVVYTPAISQDFGEMLRFRESGITIIKRAHLLGQLSQTMTCLAVAGTHGKTTTSSILAHLLYQSGVPMTAFLGGILQGHDTNYLNTGTDVMVVEADEFDRSFLQLSPDVAGITAMDPDHLDIYGDEKEFVKAFKEFAGRVPNGNLFVHHNVQLTGKKVGVMEGDVHVSNLSIVDGSYHFDLFMNGTVYPGFELKMPGHHNLSNALLAIAMASTCKVSIDDLRIALASFSGVQRRFSYRLDNDEFTVIDDYAHHPKEIDAVYDAVTEMYPEQEYTVIFQPHLFSRTRDFLEEFAVSLSRFHKVGLLDIYPARELPIEGIKSQVLCTRIMAQPNAPQQCIVVAREDVSNFIKDMNSKIVLLLGAGDIGQIIPQILENIQA